MKKKKVLILTGLIIILAIAILVIILVNTKEKKVYLSDLNPDYYTVGYYDLKIDKDYNDKPLSLNINENEQEFDKGFFAHAYSTIVFDNLKKYNLKAFSTYIGVGKTARNNMTTSIRFYIYFDQELVYQSDEMNGRSEALFVELVIKRVNRITLVIDDLGGNGSDHGIWANPILTYSGWRNIS